ncbi:MAG: bifunctional precorrin-2 dehydrogenase/sirohydrochlorin ferrochelatase [Candidatus Binatia bacterium]
MKTYPVFLDLRGKRCLVVGGGVVAQRKVHTLVGAGAKVTIISPDLPASLQKMGAQKRIQWLRRRYRQGDLKGCFLAFGATDNPKVNRDMADEAKLSGSLINVVDRPGLCNFISPAVVRRGELLIAISTGGASPGLAKKIRQDLERIFGQDYVKALELLGALRKVLRRRSLSSADRKRILTGLINSPLLDHIRQRKKVKLERLLSRIAGGDWNLSDLGVSL